jgi:hypothetical protein
MHSQTFFSKAKQKFCVCHVQWYSLGVISNDYFHETQSPATSNWRTWSGAILPCYVKLLHHGDPRLVGLYYRTKSTTRCVIRLEWSSDDKIWTRDALDAPWHVHASGPAASREWADFICDKYRLEWACDELQREFRQRGVAA